MSEKKVVRTHDKFYLNENRKFKPKEYFKFIVNQLDLSLNGKSVIDIGCATGDFLYYLSSCFPKAELYGADIDSELLERMRIEVPIVKESFNIDISNPKTNIGKYDAVFMLGVHSIFDQLDWILSIKSLLMNKNSRGYIFGIFNPDELDVLIKGRKSNSNEAWETGWNVFSKASIGKYMEKNGLDYSFKDFNIDIDIEKNINDPLRSWTINKESKGKIVVNGLSLIHYFSLCEVRLI